ncbi:helix-turn-helix domain-containing protein [Euzebya sp.]|uniref:helix-turn-helix domain-containing protein n=1 Tax=Euzebya sp. TaxID=1971409 RepID=UPI003514E5FB
MGQRAEYVTAEVGPDLRGLVDSVHCYDLSGFAPGEHLGLPSPAVTFIIALDDGVEMRRMPRADRAPGRFRALVGGLHDGPVVIGHDGAQAGIQLGLSAGATRALLGVPAAAVAGEVVELADLWGPVAARALVEQVGEAPDWPTRTAAIATTFRRRLALNPLADDAHRSDATLDASWAMLTGPALHPVADVAAQVGWSRRNLTDRVTREFGVSPVVARAMARFDRARALVASTTGPLAAVAACAGYADQSHMVREWRRFTGLSPTGWLTREDFPSVQAGTVAADR